MFSGWPTVLSTNPHKFKILISTEEYNRDDESNGLACRLQFTYTEKYPDTEPVVEIEDEVNFEDNFCAELLENVNATVSERIPCGWDRCRATRREKSTPNR